MSHSTYKSLLFLKALCEEKAKDGSTEALLSPFLLPWPISRYLGLQQEASSVGALGWEEEGISWFSTLPKLLLLLLRFSTAPSSLRMIILFWVINLSF